ncbi:probable threonine dehydratase, mitochondrial precursor [Fusarium mangiferae]|uniref:Probable threonine dehydratase, mitochondrial n=1 Tax=Fusarium mangiferae TaxID=192010 RepID=A0A1L7U7Q2_FUSMA|nr:putative threonine dehydratase, mitochondrial precursor [Fusarium mangiferae]CVL03531.1 probable threonine dehydratase, mitochondrial precursor [Fusarium mangiferae]
MYDLGSIECLATADANLAQYLQLILTARVHEVATPTPLTKAHGLSEELGCNVMFKREDTQPGYSYRLRGIYNRMANLDKERRWKGVITSSASDALAVAYAAKVFRIPSMIVLPGNTTKAKIKELKRLGSTVKLHGLNADATKEESLRLQSLHDLISIPQPGDEYVIAGHGKVGQEIIQQTISSQVQAVFCPIACGTLIAGLGIYLKRIAPQIKVVGVQLHDSADISRLMNFKGQSTLEEHLLSRDVGAKVARICSDVIDDIVQVTIDEVLIATKNIYEDTRQLLNIEGALAVAGMKSWITSNGLLGSEADFVAITSEAQLDFSEISRIVKQASLAEMALGGDDDNGIESLMHGAGSASTCAGDGWSSSTTVVGAETCASFASDVDARLWNS